MWFPTTPSRFLRLDEDPVGESLNEIRYSRGSPSAPAIRESRVTIKFQRRRPEDDFQNAEDWKTLFTKTFKREVGSLDKKLQGRVMEAVLEIAEEPVKLVGDTKKPLVARRLRCRPQIPASGAWPSSWQHGARWPASRRPLQPAVCCPCLDPPASLLLATCYAARTPRGTA